MTVGPSSACWPVTRIVPGSPSLVRYLNPATMARGLWLQRDLIWQFTRREVEGRYRGSLLGIFWSFINPLVLLAVYTLVAGLVFKVRWPESQTNGLGEFALLLFCGLIAFNVVSECSTRAVGLVLAVPNFVKRVAFPLEVLPLSVLGSALFHAGLGIGVLLAVGVLTTRSLPWSVVLLPLVVLPLVFLCLGLSWLLASLGVYLRDLSYVVPLALQVVFFASPIMYPAQSMPAPFRAVLLLNPLAWVVESLRRLIFGGTPPDARGLALWTLTTAAFTVFGYAWFMKTKKGFVDVM